MGISELYGTQNSRRDFFKYVLTASVLSTSALDSLQSLQKRKQPNILFITTDYTRGVDLPSYGSPFLEMPNIDQLCKEGAVFTNHVSTCPICMPARASWVTGFYPHTHGLWDNQNYSFRKDGPFLMRDLQKLGYLTAGIGKMHFYPWQDDYNFDIRVSHEGQDLSNSVNDDYNNFLKKHGYDRDKIRKFKDAYDISGGQAIYEWPIDEKLHHDYFVGNETIKVIRNGKLKDENPWFMWVSFTGPHNPWNAPKRVTDFYMEMDDLPLGDFFDGELKNKPIEFTRHRYGYGKTLFEIYDSLSQEEKCNLRRRLRASHYGSLTFIDEQIGKIIKELSNCNLLENTMIVYTSDHGSALFDNEMLHKGTHMPTQVFVPFVVWCPSRIKSGVRNNFSAHVDVYPTFIELAGGIPHSESEGNSLVPMLRDASVKIKDFDVMECTLVTAIITEKWIAGFHHYNNEIDLYDRQNDPKSHFNLANDPRYSDTIDLLRDKLVEWRRGLGPEISVSDDPLQWRECLGPETIVSKFRSDYMKQYQRLLEFDENKRPGRVGKYAAAFLKEIRT